METPDRNTPGGRDDRASGSDPQGTTPNAIDFVPHDFEDAASVFDDGQPAAGADKGARNPGASGRSRWREPLAGLPPERSEEVPPAPDEPGSEPSGAAAPMSLRASDWISPARRQFHQGLLITVAAVAGIVLAIAAIGFVIRQSSKPEAAVADARTGETQPDPTSPDAASSDPTMSGTAGPNAAGPNAAESNEVPRNDLNQNADPHASPTTEASPTETTAPLPTTENKLPGHAAAEGPQETLAVPLDAPPGLIPRATETAPDVADPLDLDPLGLTHPAASADAVEVPSATESSGPAPSSATAPRPSRRAIDVPAQLEMQLPSIEIRDTPLVDFAGLVSQLSAVPVTVDVDALVRLQISAKSPVSVQLRDAKIADVLTTALKPLALDYMLTDHDLLITQPGGGYQLTEVAYPVGTLTRGSAEELARLGEMVEQLVAPATWSKQGGSGLMKPGQETLVVWQTEAVHFEIRRLCEKLQWARDRAASPGNDSSEPGGWLDWTTRSQSAREQLKQAVSLNFARSSRLSAILQRLGSEAGVQIVVDWESLGGARLEASAEVSFVVFEQPLSEALEVLLNPLDLGYRVVDAETFLVSTRQRLADAIEIEFYRVPVPLDDPAALALIDRLKTAVGRNRFSDAGGHGAIHFDGPSGALLVALPQTEQRTVEAVLRKSGP